MNVLVTVTTAMTTEPLQTESETYRSHLGGWSAEHPGEFVLIHGDQVGFFPTLDAALSQGYESFDNDPFFVKEVVGPEHLEFIAPQF